MTPLYSTYLTMYDCTLMNTLPTSLLRHMQAIRQGATLLGLPPPRFRQAQSTREGSCMSDPPLQVQL